MNLRNFAIFTGKSQTCNFIKKRFRNIGRSCTKRSNRAFFVRSVSHVKSPFFGRISCRRGHQLKVDKIFKRFENEKF